MIVFIDFLHFWIFAALYQNAAAWDQCAGSADDLKGKIQNLSRCNICPAFCSVLQLCNIFAKLTDQNKMDGGGVLEAARFPDFRFRKSFGDQRFMGQGEVRIYFDLAGVKGFFIHDEVNRTPAALQKRKSLCAQEIFYV